MSVLFTVSQVLSATGGRLLRGDPDAGISGVVIDSREVKRGDLFVALPGDQTDGHKFVGAAARRGAAAVLVSQDDVELPEAGSFAAVRVDDGARALGDLARFYRGQFDSLDVVAVTGSVGKTTTKDMIAGVLSKRAPVLKTYANWNTELGVPLMVLQLRPEHRYAVLELAMRGRGEIRSLTRIAGPRIGVITNIQDTHMELLGTQENIARAKAELLEELPPDGTAVLNADDEWVRRVAPSYTGRTIWYGVSERADFRADTVSSHGKSLSASVIGPEGCCHEIRVPVPGEHNVYNLLAAAAACRELCVSWSDIEQGLESVELTGMRMQVLELGSVTVLNDTYNANPASTIAALRALRSLAGERRRIVVLGDMLELGDREEPGHREVGRAVAAEQPAWLVTVGARMRWAADEAVRSGLRPSRVLTLDDCDEARLRLLPLLEEGDVVLVKASRGMALERIVDALVGELE